MLLFNKKNLNTQLACSRLHSTTQKRTPRNLLESCIVRTFLSHCVTGYAVQSVRRVCFIHPSRRLLSSAFHLQVTGKCDHLLHHCLSIQMDLHLESIFHVAVMLCYVIWTCSAHRYSKEYPSVSLKRGRVAWREWRNVRQKISLQFFF